LNGRLVICLALLLGACATPQTRPDGEAALLRHIRVLADDSFAGRLPGSPGGTATEAYVARQFAAAGLAPGWRGASWFQPVEVATDKARPEVRVRAHNVIGRIAGTGTSGEAILFMAHWDHIGLCQPPRASDRICNGAVDNASGVAALIEIARKLAREPRPDRDILFVATTAEELGLVGARAFAADPPHPLGVIVAALNLDTVAVAPRGEPVSIVGRGLTALDPFVDETARTLGRRVDASDGPNALVRRQDGWALLQKGVPAILVGGAYGSGRLQRFLSTRYHKPDDDLASGVELGGAAEDVDLHVALGRLFGDSARFPTPPRPAPLDTTPSGH
jgi:Zn-dependent M28 family amino/carboxypeptidase